MLPMWYHINIEGVTEMKSADVLRVLGVTGPTLTK